MTDLPEQRPEARALLDRMVGRWVLSGAIAGQQTVHDVEARWTLQDLYVEITEVSRERGEGGRPAYEARIFLGWATDHYFCQWFDNTGVATGDVSCAAAPGPDRLQLEFTDRSGALLIVTTFAYHRAVDQWSWQIENVQDGKRERFADVSLQRAAEPAKPAG